jgi:hypothetical protein
VKRILQKAETFEELSMVKEKFFLIQKVDVLKNIC